ncbi:carbohydrate sulfotransferase 9-like [Pecten maximus]|uniref:carbohydrate sulfotransferase 9-like n=1 Tax=Pecten maximus TaxID=6579 RepID=UPI001458A149|nr:carbohydrate sulfotransferase 9-like [Pecten maximus]
MYICIMTLKGIKRILFMFGVACVAVLILSYKYISTEDLQGTSLFVQTKNLPQLMMDGQGSLEKFKERQAHLLENCHPNTNFEKNPKFEYVKKRFLLYDSKSNFVFCMVQKIGCTFWRRLFHSLKYKDISDVYTINPEKVHTENLPTLGHLNITEASRVLRSANTAMFVRDPYERIFSAYLDKLYNINRHYMEHLGRDIVKSRKKPTTLSLRCGHDVSFSELIRYLVEQKRKSQEVDEHFSPIHTHCLPCQIKYNFTGKMESFDEDVSEIMTKTGIFQNVSGLMSRKSSISKEINSSIYNSILDAYNTRKSMSQCMTMNEMYGRVWTILQLRGFLNPDLPMPDSPHLTVDMVYREAIKNSDPSRVSEYKHRGLVKMYKTVDRQLLLQFREYVLLDCQLFGYNDRPPYIFSDG